MRRDLGSFAVCYRSELDGLLRLAYVVSGNQSTAEDIVAEAVTRVWARWRKDDIDDLRAYLRRAVVNEVIGQGRRRRHRERRAPLLPHPETMSTDRSVDDRHLLWGALLELPVEQRAVIALRYLTDLTEAQTAATLGIPLGTVKSRVSRGLEQLRLTMTEVGHDA
jgi:RNA polymerase sigma-70 factor (sigma-E family)